MIEPTEQADDGQRTFECWTCSYSETVVLTSSGESDRSRT